MAVLRPGGALLVHDAIGDVENRDLRGLKLGGGLCKGTQALFAVSRVGGGNELVRAGGEEEEGNDAGNGDQPVKWSDVHVSDGIELLRLIKDLPVDSPLTVTVGYRR